MRGASFILRAVEKRDRDAFLEMVRRSRALHRPWVQPPSTPKAFETYLKRVSDESIRGLLLCRREDGAIAGAFNLSQIFLGNFRSAYLGYFASADFAGQGVMKLGLRGVLRYAFRTVRLHRVEANVQPENRASIALARSCGFSKEGFSPRYLKVGGRWRDHERWAITVEDWRR